MSSGEYPEFWPAWLADDVPESAIWNLEHESAPTIFRDASMHLVDRTNNLLPRLLSEPALASGDIYFVAHSFGGLLVEQILRAAQPRAAREETAASFLRRVRRIVFLGTPHHGADLATWGGRLRVLSRASYGLARNDPNLRGLNQWFRLYATENGIELLVLTEAHRTGFLLGRIVAPDSADLGLASIPIPVDANHFTIAAPATRSSEIYQHVRDFLTKPATSVHPHTELNETIAIRGLCRLEGRLWSACGVAEAACAAWAAA
jgi:hypothetical protein